MKKTLFLLLAIIGISSMTIASEKPRIYIAPFKYEGTDIRKLLPPFRSAVVQGAGSSRRVDLVDTQSAEMAASDVMEAARNAQCDYVMQCELFNHNLNDAINLALTVASLVDNKMTTLYDRISYDVKFIRVSDGVVVSSKKLSNTGVAFAGGYTSYYNAGALDEASRSALEWVVRQMATYVEYMFPVEARILEVDEVKKDKVKSLYVNLGSNAPIYEKMYFSVFIQKSIAGEKARDWIGQVRVTLIKGENISLCKVKKGDKAIFKAIEEGKDILLVSEVH